MDLIMQKLKSNMQKMMSNMQQINKPPGAYSRIYSKDIEYV